MSRLFERSKLLAENVNKLIKTDDIANKVDYLGSRASQFENLLVCLRTSTGKARQLERHGIIFERATDFQGSLYFLKEMQAKFVKDSSTIREVKDIKPKILNPIQNGSSQIENAVNKAWHEHIHQQLPRVSNELLDALFKIPGLKSEIDCFRKLICQAQRKRNRVPTDEVEFDQTLDLIRRCKQAWSKLDAKDIPLSVKDFFHDAGTRKGAELSRLTPEILDWLAKNNLTDKLRIIVASEGY